MTMLHSRPQAAAHPTPHVLRPIILDPCKATSPRAEGWLKIVLNRIACTSVLSNKERLNVECEAERWSQDRALEFLPALCETVRTREQQRCRVLRHALTAYLHEHATLLRRLPQGPQWLAELHGAAARMAENEDWDRSEMERAYARAQGLVEAAAAVLGVGALPAGATVVGLPR